jgi:hypothetical protein
MTKIQFKKEAKGMFNSVRKINGINIANVAWLNEPWLIIENEETFEDARKDNFVPIIMFRTLEDLTNAIIKN